MSNHFSADKFKFPGDDRRLDLTDVFVFPSTEDPGKTVLIIDSNPTNAPPPVQPIPSSPEFYPGAVYRINIDNDGDAQADVAFTFVFSEYENGSQTGTAWYVTGSQARQPEPAGEVLADSIPVGFGGIAQPVQAGPVRLFAGRRSDPFFADVEGALHGLQWTGHDDFAGNNVNTIALEVPGDILLGAASVIGVWASISRRRDGVLEQMDRAGNPSMNPFINPDGEEGSLQLPAAHRRRGQLPAALDQDPGRRRLLTRGGRGGGHASAARHPPLRPHRARRLPQRPQPHRRHLQLPLCLADQRQGPADRPQPHDDLLAHFPYVGPPHP